MLPKSEVTIHVSCFQGSVHSHVDAQKKIPPGLAQGCGWARGQTSPQPSQNSLRLLFAALHPKQYYHPNCSQIWPGPRFCMCLRAQCGYKRAVPRAGLAWHPAGRCSLCFTETIPKAPGATGCSTMGLETPECGGTLSPTWGTLSLGGMQSLGGGSREGCDHGIQHQGPYFQPHRAPGCRHG